LRLTCDELSRKTFHYLGFTYFATFRTDLSSSSLQKLKQVSKAELAPYIKTLLIQASNSDVGYGFTWKRTRSKCLIFPHPAVQAFQETILQLENCRSFHICEDYEKDIDELHYLMPSDIIAIVFHAIGKLNRPLQSLTVESIDAPTMVIIGNQLHLTNYQKLGFQQAWAGLQELNIRRVTVQPNFDWVVDLIRHAQDLKILKLDFHYEHNALFFDQVLSYDKLPRLQEIDLSGMSYHNDALLKMVPHLKDSLRILR
jgi:hypothetical protein